jgi:type IV secretion system protein VirD4
MKQNLVFTPGVLSEYMNERPRVMQVIDDSCSFVVNVQSEEFAAALSEVVGKAGYECKMLNLNNPAHSNRYNPFENVKSEKDVEKLAEAIIGKDEDVFYQKGEVNFLEALILYLVQYRPKEEQNLSSLPSLIRAAIINETNGDSLLDKEFGLVQKQDPGSLAAKHYWTFRTAMNNVNLLKSALIACYTKLSEFEQEPMKSLITSDDIHLSNLEYEKTILFIVSSQKSNASTVLRNILGQQLWTMVSRSSYDRAGNYSRY